MYVWFSGQSRRRLRVRAGLQTALVGGMLMLGLSACSSQFASSKPDLGVPPPKRILPETAEHIPKGGGTYKLGNPYQIAGVWYYPKEETGYNRVGIASWYGIEGHGRETANGEVFDMRALTAAHPTLPIPSYAYVTNLANGRTVLVRINDRGPYANDRIIDLSREAAHLLGFTLQGTARVQVVYAGRAPLDGNDSAERRFLMAQAWYRQQNQAVAFAPPSRPVNAPPAYAPPYGAARPPYPAPAWQQTTAPPAKPWMKPLPWEQAGSQQQPSGLGGPAQP